MLRFLFSFQFTKARRYLQTRKLAKLITVFLFLVVFLAVAVGVFVFFQQGLSYIQKTSEQYILPAVFLYIYEMFFLVIMFLMVLSGLIVGLSNFGRNTVQDWIVGSPSFMQLPRIMLWKIFVLSFWPIAVIVLPALLAINAVFHLGVEGIAGGLLLVFLLGGLVSIFDYLVILGAAKLADLFQFNRKDGGLSLGKLVFWVAGIFFVLAILSWWYVGRLDVSELLRISDFDYLRADSQIIASKFFFFPSHAAAQGIFLAQLGNWVGLWKDVSVLVILLALLFMFWQETKKWLLVVWQKMQEGNFIARSDDFRPAALDKKPFPRYFNSPVGAIFEKEGLMIFRNLKNLMWLAFSMFLWLIYAGINAIISRHLNHFESYSKGLEYVTGALQLMVAVYFSSTLVLRFALPSFSSERKTAWVLASSPLDFGKLFWAKAIFYSFLFSVIGLLMGYFSIAFFDYPVSTYLALMFLFLVTVVFLTLFGLCLGVFFPNFDTDDPEQISTSLSGLGFMAGALAYGAVGTFCFYLFLKSVSGWVVVFEIGSLVASLALAKISLGRIKKIEFIRHLG